MIGAKVVHKAFGDGIVTGQSDGYIRIRFAAGEREFPFPRAFDGFLTTDDPEILAELDRLRKAALEEQARWGGKSPESRRGKTGGARPAGETCTDYRGAETGGIGF